MPSRLVLCASCDRHVLASETKCPFCRFVMGVMTASAGLALLGCPDKQTKPEVDASASALASAPASASASASPSASASAAMDPFDAGGGVGLGDLRVGAGVYGPASNNTSGSRGLAGIGAQRGECVVGPSTATVAIPNADRVLATMRPRFRASYNNKLQSNPSLAGTYKYKVTVGADGVVTAAEAVANELGDELGRNLTEILKRAQFDAPGKTSVLTGTVTCKPSS